MKELFDLRANAFYDLQIITCSFSFRSFRFYFLHFFSNNFFCYFFLCLSLRLSLYLSFFCYLSNHIFLILRFSLRLSLSLFIISLSLSLYLGIFQLFFQLGEHRHISKGRRLIFSLLILDCFGRFSTLFLTVFFYNILCFALDILKITEVRNHDTFII